MKKKFQEVKLDDALKFYNGKAIALNGVGLYPVYGSNGIVGYSDKFIFENCIVIGRVGEYCGSIQYCKEKFWATDNTIVVKPKDGYDVQYLSYLLALINLNWFSGGSAQPLITHGWIKPIKASIPNYKTQNKIGSILFGYDDVIDNNLQRIKLLEEYAQITFNDWFINIKKLPKGWQEINLGSLVGYEIGGGWGEEIQNREFSEAAYVIRGTDIDTLPLGKLENVPYRFHKKSNLASRKLQDGDIVFEVSGGSSFEGVAKTLFITDELLKQFKSDVMCASFCKLLRPSERRYSNFVFLLLRFLRAAKATEVFEIRSASNIVNYNWTAFLKFEKVKVPDEKVLQQFNEIIDPIYKQIYNLGNQNRLLKEARDILLPRLMTGMIKVETEKLETA